MKIGIFTDIHYCTEHPEIESVRYVMDIFREQKVDVCLCLGDFIDKSVTAEETDKRMEELVSLVKEYPYPFYLIPGNHDYTCYSGEEYSRRTGLPLPPYTVDIDKVRFIFLDASYRSNMLRYDETKMIWQDSNLPPDQVTYLEKRLQTAKKCVVCIHEALDPRVQPEHIVRNASRVREIIECAGNVPYVLQGHFHPGAERLIRGVRYLTVPALFRSKENYRIITVE